MLNQYRIAGVAWLLAGLFSLGCSSSSSGGVDATATPDDGNEATQVADAAGDTSTAVKLAVQPAVAVVPAAGKPLVLTAGPVPEGQSLAWAMAPQLGTLVGNADGTATFTPPSSVDHETSVVVTATTGDAHAQATVVVTPWSQLAIAPASAELLEGSAPLSLVATMKDSEAAVAWTLSPVVGTLSAASGLAVDYTPPATVGDQTLVLVRATAGSAVATTAILVKPKPAVPELTVSPESLSLEAGTLPAILIATLKNSDAPVTWSLEPALGTLSTTQGAAVGYTPPASVDAKTTVVATAKAAGLTAHATIEVDVVTNTQPTLAVTPGTADATSGGAAVLLTADVQNSTDVVLWSLSPTVGTLSGTSGATVTYVPPATLDVETAVTVFAMLGDLRRQAVITVHPAPTLSVAPATSTITTANPGVTLTATLLNSSAGITWTWSPAVGLLSPTAGPTANYTPPASVIVPTTVVVTASAAGIAAQATIVVQAAAGDAKVPLLNKRFVPFTRIVEYLVLGTSNNGTAYDQFVVDPYLAYGRVDDQPVNLPPGTTIPDKAILHHSLNADLTGDMSKVARAGNFDDDFPEETAVLTWKPQVAGQAVPAGVQPAAKLTILDAVVTAPGGDPITVVVPTGVDLTVEAGQNATDYDLAVADVDGDGYDEIVVVGTVYWDGANAQARHKGKLWVLKHDPTQTMADGWTVTHQLTLDGALDSSLAWRGLGMARLAVGSMTDNRQAQIVVAWVDEPALHTAWTSTNATGRNGVGPISYAIYDGATLAKIGDNRKTASIQNNLEDSLNNPNLFSVAMADVDGDRKKELVFAAWNAEMLNGYPNISLSSRPGVQILDDLDQADAAGALTSLAIAVRPYEGSAPNWQSFSAGQINSYPRNFVLAWDYNGDMTDELVVANYPFHYVKPVGSTPGSIAWDDGVKVLSKADYHNIADIQVGDVNGDRRQDFIVLEHEGRVRAWGLRDKLLSVSGYPLVKTYQANPEFLLLDTSGTNGTYNKNAILVPVNVDGDSTMLEYTGFTGTPKAPLALAKTASAPVDSAHVVVYGNNKLVAVLAAPPIHANLGQSEGNNQTTFGTSSGGSYSNSVDVAARVGVIIGAEADFFGVFSADVEAQFMLEYTHSDTWTHTETHTLTYGASDDSDQVVFATTPYDRYIYNVASSPTPANVGGYLVVDVPRQSTVLSVQRDVYNSTFSDGIQITKDLLGDTPYDLASYPKGKDLPGSHWVDVGTDQKLLARYQSFGSHGPNDVGQGHSSVSDQATIEDEQAWSNGVTFSVDVTATMTMGGTKAGGTFGFSVGGSWEQTISNGLEFGATVYNIPSAQDFAANDYQWGIFAYKQQLCTHEPVLGTGIVQDFFVVNYWVVN